MQPTKIEILGRNLISGMETLKQKQTSRAPKILILAWQYKQTRVLQEWFGELLLHLEAGNDELIKCEIRRVMPVIEHMSVDALQKYHEGRTW